MKIFHTASDEEIKKGETTDIYFIRTIEVLKKKGIKKNVAMEIKANSLPNNYNWAIFLGVEEVARLLEGIPVNVWAMEEGEVFLRGEPVMLVEGEYTTFGHYETPILGMLCQASGAGTKAARCRIAAGDRLLLSFGARRMHPALAPMIDRAAYIGGCDGVSVVKSAELLGIEPTGTMPHSLILIIGEPIEAFLAFDEVIDEKIKRVCLVDTLYDEKQEAIAAAEALGRKLFGVRLDTPESRRGDIREILREVRWELDIRGYDYVKIYLSGGVDEKVIEETKEFADAYGVGTAISNAPTINFAMDIVEVEGKPFAKRGKLSGRKQVWKCKKCGKRMITKFDSPNPSCCDEEMEGLLKPLIIDG
ncbi:nicotinate phosphoribosyltransferase, partial [bacterium]|nr:nicotinate phosphoribosyltransferase [bacterium]